MKWLLHTQALITEYSINSTSLVTNACDNSVAVVTASYYAFRSLGYVLGISVVSTVVQQYLRSILHVKLQSYDIDVDAVVDEVTRSIESLQTLNPEISAIVRDCYGKAMNKGFLVVFVIAVIGAISALRIRVERRAGSEERSDLTSGLVCLSIACLNSTCCILDVIL